MTHSTETLAQRNEKAKALRFAELAAGREAQKRCGNATVTVELKSENPELLKFEYITKATGCKRLRRHASRYCQHCSDAHAQRNAK